MIQDFLAEQAARGDRPGSRNPLGRIGTTEDIAYGVVYLSSDESSFVTGSELVIDGGSAAQQLPQPQEACKI
jgi:NAD(P)-dependent dehydrogenase (short-subunit alcohol dehydrogenase family)